MTESLRSSNPSDTNTSYFDTLRIVACFFVVLAHVAGGSADEFAPYSKVWWLCKGLFFLCLWTIPVFVMISGALLLSQRPSSTRTFYGRRLKRIGVPLVFWTVFYLGVRVFLDHESLTAFQILNFLFHGNAYCHLWFLYMMAGLYLVTPLLQILIQRLSILHCQILAVSVLVVADILNLCNVMVWGIHASVFTLFVPYTGYYLLGYLIHQHWPKGRIPGTWVGTASVLSVVYLMCLARPFIQLKGGQFGIFFFGFFAIPIAMMAIAIFWAFREICMKPLSPRLSHLASCTLGIYVVHLFVLKLMQVLLADEASDQAFWITLIFGTLIAFALSYGIVTLLKKIPVICRTVG